MNYRALFISDLHIGSERFRHADFFDFLDHNKTDRLYLLGDIVDTWALRTSAWTEKNTLAIKRLLSHENVFYLPGNHDKVAMLFVGSISNVKIASTFVHVAKTKKRYLLLHGDEFDFVDWATRVAARLFNAPADNNIVSGVLDFIVKKRIMREAARRGVDGVICGHSHRPHIENGAPAYLNCGDWVTNCTAIGEDQDGEFHLIRWKLGT